MNIHFLFLSLLPMCLTFADQVRLGCYCDFPIICKEWRQGTGLIYGTLSQSWSATTNGIWWETLSVMWFCPFGPVMQPRMYWHSWGHLPDRALLCGGCTCLSPPLDPYSVRQHGQTYVRGSVLIFPSWFSTYILFVFFPPERNSENSVFMYICELGLIHKQKHQP